MERELRGELFLAHAVGHVSTPASIVREFPEASVGCPVEDAAVCLFDRSAAQRALMWAIADSQTFAAIFLVSECGARVDIPLEKGGESPITFARRVGTVRIREIAEEAYSEIRMEEIVSRRYRYA